MNNALSQKYQYLTAQKQACSGQPMSCYQGALAATQAAYAQAQVDVATQCGTGGDVAACQTARNDVAQLYLNGQSLQQFVQSTPSCQTVECVAGTTVGSGLLGLVGGWLLGKFIGAARGLFVDPAPVTSGPSASSRIPTAGDIDLPNVYANQVQAPATNTSSGSAPMINGVTVTDRATGNVYQGTVDLQPTLDRIANGVKYPSRNDGTTFNNNEGLLPRQPAGYYTEYVVPTPGVNGVGPQRIVTGQGGEVYYTPDHYQTFIPVKK